MGMWDSFILASLCGIVILYLPGLLINKALHFDTLLSLVMAPAVSCLCVVVVGIVLYLIPVQMDGLILAVSVLGVSFIVLVVSLIVSGRGNDLVAVTSTGLLSKIPKSMTRFSMMGLQSAASNWALSFLYILVAFAITAYMFLGNIGVANSIPGSFAESPAFNAIFNLAQTGVFSVVTGGLMPESGEFVFSFQSLWQVLPACIASISGFDYVLCFNAVLAIFLVFVIPLGTFGILSIVFHRNRLLIATGAVFALSFGAFPWLMVLFPDQIACLIAVAFVPYVFIAVLGITIQGSQRQSKMVYIFLLFSVIASIVCSFPNIVLAVTVMCVPYLISRYFCWVNDFGKFDNSFLAKAMGVVVSICVCFLIWIVFCNIPISSTANFNQEPYIADPLAVISGICLLGLVQSAGMQIVLGVMVVCGALILLFKKGFRWIAATWTVCVLVYALCALLPEVVLKYAFGFWYANPAFIGSLVCVASVPLAAIFSETVIRAFAVAICSLTNGKHSKGMLVFVGCVYLLVFAGLNMLVHSTVFGDGFVCDNTLSVAHREIDESYVFVNEQSAFVASASLSDEGALNS